ncbi:MAG: hypothetical protein JWN67_1058 [Actinomycetia bacterium]|nr:hypothetical protein [Actinomycetes bacterium]
MIDAEWHAVRCIFDHGGTYEERITLWHTADFEEAIELAELEATQYASDQGGSEYAGLAQVYALPGVPDHGAEVFSLMRDSELGTNDYLDAFFDTGQERQGHVED